MNVHEYRCALCDGQFHDHSTEEERLDEYRNIWGKDISAKEEDIYHICDDCWKELGRRGMLPRQ